MPRRYEEISKLTSYYSMIIHEVAEPSQDSECPLVHVCQFAGNNQ